MTARTSPTAEQMAALDRWRWHHGRYWRSRLLQAWIANTEADEAPRRDDGPLLRQIRNTVGPTWLRDYRPE